LQNGKSNFYRMLALRPILFSNVLVWTSFLLRSHSLLVQRAAINPLKHSDNYIYHSL
jgi:hypothetical protein